MTKRIRVGIIGANPDRGWAAQARIPALQSLSDDFEITALSTSRRESAEAASMRISLPACDREMSPGAHRLKRRRGREVLLRLRVVKLMVKRHGLEAIARLIAAQRLAKSVQVRRVAIDQQLGDSLRVGQRTGREYAT